MEYSLWDIETNRYLGRFTDEKEALALVRKLVNHYGPGYAEFLDLGAVDDAGTALEPISGAMLIARVEEVLEGADEERRGVLVAS